jgi:hypothetical protein
MLTFSALLAIGISSYASASSYFIPAWIKHNAGWWASGKVGDSDFVKGIQYMIQNNIMKIPPSQGGTTHSQVIPSWIKHNAGWWADGQISDDEFVKGIQYLIQVGIINLPSTPASVSGLAFGLAAKADTAYLELVQKYQTNPNDIVANSVQNFAHYPNASSILFSSSLQGITNIIQTETSNYKIDFVAYDVEHWTNTPIAEQNDPIGSINKGADLVHNAGLKFAIAPDRQFLLANYKNIDWTRIDLVNLQLQTLANDPVTYSQYAQSIVSVIKSQNPKTEIFIQVSFTKSNTTQIINAIESVKNIVDGIYIHLDKVSVCPNCTLSNLEQVLSTISTAK